MNAPNPWNEVRCSGDAFQARATHAPHRANLRCLGLSVGIAIALSGCRSPWSEQADFDDRSANTMSKSVALDEKMVNLLLDHDRRISALEAASAGEADRPKRGGTRGSVHEHAAPERGDAR